jgi:hypothetical protein
MSRTSATEREQRQEQHLELLRWTEYRRSRRADRTRRSRRSGHQSENPIKPVSRSAGTCCVRHGPQRQKSIPSGGRSRSALGYPATPHPSAGNARAPSTTFQIAKRCSADRLSLAVFRFPLSVADLRLVSRSHTALGAKAHDRQWPRCPSATALDPVPGSSTYVTTAKPAR